MNSVYPSGVQKDLAECYQIMTLWMSLNFWGLKNYESFHK